MMKPGQMTWALLLSITLLGNALNAWGQARVMDITTATVRRGTGALEGIINAPWYRSVQTTATAFTKTQSDARYLRAGVAGLDDLSDAVISSPQTGQPLVFNGVGQEVWSNTGTVIGEPYIDSQITRDGEMVDAVGEATEFMAETNKDNNFSTTQTAIASKQSTITLGTTLVMGATKWLKNKWNYTAEYSRTYNLADTTITLQNEGYDSYFFPYSGLIEYAPAVVNLVIDGSVRELGAVAHDRGAIAKGSNAEASGSGVAIGNYAKGMNSGTGIGWVAQAVGGIAISGGNAQTYANGGVAIDGGATTGTGIAIGPSAVAIGAGFPLAIGYGAKATAPYSSAIGLNCVSLGYGGHVYSDTSTNTALTGFLVAPHSRIRNKGTDIAGQNSGSDGADCFIAGYFMDCWGLRNGSMSSMGGRLYGDYGTQLSSENADISNGHNHVVSINAKYDSPTTISTSSGYLTQFHAPSYHGIIKQYGEIQATNDVATSGSFRGSGETLTGLSTGIVSESTAKYFTSARAVSATSTTYQAADSDVAALALNGSNGLWARTGSGTGTARTITQGTGVTVTNGDGVSGNPTIAIGQAVATSSSPTFAGLTATTLTAQNIISSMPILPQDDCIFYCRMRSASAANLTNVIDSVAPTLTGSPTAGTITDSTGRDSVGYGLTLSGTGQYLSFGNLYNLTTGDFSMAAWFKTAAGGYIASKQQNGGSYAGYGIYLNSSSGALYLLMRDATPTDVTGSFSATDYRDGIWHHVVVSVSRSSIATAYVDGLKIGTRTVSTASSSLTNTSPFYIGTTNGAQLFNGSLDEVLVFGRALTRREVLCLYLNGTIQTD